MKQRPRRRRVRPRHVLLGLAMLSLAALTIYRTGAAALAEGNPRLALLLQSGEPRALIETAQRRLEAVLTEQRSAQERAAREASAAGGGGKAKAEAKGAATPPAAAADPEPPRTDQTLLPGAPVAEDISSAARRALLGAPVDARPLRLLAQLADAAGDKEHKQHLLQVIVQRTKHEPLATYWLMLDAFEHKDHAEVVRLADIVLSKHPDLAPHVAPVLVNMLEQRSGDQEVKERLRANPAWRRYFFAALPAAISDARTPLDLLLALKGSTAPPAEAEIRIYLDFLFSRKLYEIAYYTWLQMLEPAALKAVLPVNNGSFETAPTTLPFDWTIPPSPGATVRIRQAADSMQKALFIEFGHGRVEFLPVRQQIVLAPGRYELKVRQRGDVSGRRGLQWLVLCAENSKRLAETPMLLGKFADWTSVTAEFSIPEENCRAQQISLHLAARTASEQLVKGVAWFDDVQIVRQTGN